MVVDAPTEAAPAIAGGLPGPRSPEAPSRLRVEAGSGPPVRVTVRGRTLGGAAPVFIAGPCAIESEAQLDATARRLSALGVGFLRAGAFKPRTSPYSFQGLGEEGLAILQAVAARYDLVTVTEVITPDHVPLVAAHADILQIGARSMQHTDLLRAVGRAGKPVLLKRAFTATLDEWLHAAEYIAQTGNERIILCERGIRTFSQATRATLDLSSVPLVRSRSRLPVVVDVSHAAGRRDIVPDLARAALAVGAHGVMVEIHPDPDRALSDADQQLDLDAFQALVEEAPRELDRVRRLLRVTRDGRGPEVDLGHLTARTDGERPAVVVATADGSVLSQSPEARDWVGDGVGRACWDVVGSMPGAHGLPCRPGCVGELLRGGPGETGYAQFEVEGDEHELYCLPMGPLAVCVFGRDGRHAPALGHRESVRTRHHVSAFDLGGVPARLHTFAADEPLAGPAALRAFYDRVVRSVATDGGSILHEKAFGDAGAATDAGVARAVAFGAAGLDADLPWSFVGQRPCVGGVLAGVQVWTVDGDVRTVELDGAPVGRLLETEAERVLLLTAMATDDRSADAPAQASAMFARTQHLLEREGFAFRDVARTWIYIDRLLDWYDAFNVARSDFFVEVGVRHPERPFEPPASTGIQGAHPLGAECFMDVLAVQRRDGSGERAFRILRTDRQNEAYDYGSAFSRGVAAADDERLLLISGTASIDTSGRTIYVDDHQGQLVESFADAAAVLRDGGGSLAQTVSAVHFFKDVQAWATFRELVEAGLMPDLPGLHTFADVCRHDLLFELEVTAVRAAKP